MAVSSPLVRLESINFLDHNIMTHEAVSWEARGRRYPDVEWHAKSGKAHPFTISLNQELMAELTFEILNQKMIKPGMAGKCTLQAVDTRLELLGKFKIVDSSKIVVYAMSFRKIRPKPGIVKTRFKWRIKFNIAAIEIEGTVPELTFYITYSRPRLNLERNLSYTLEFTEKRIRAAIDLVCNPKVFDEDIGAMIHNLIRLIPEYRLDKAPSELVPDQFSHPDYLMTPSGIWPLLEYHQHAAECQAIARMVIAVIDILGIPVSANLVYVFCLPENPDVPVIVEEGQKNPKFLRKYDARHDSIIESYFLTSEIGIVSKFDWTPEDKWFTDKNQFEACIKISKPSDFIYKNTKHLRHLNLEYNAYAKSRYFPAGMQKNKLHYRRSPDRILTDAFRYLIHCQYDTQKILRKIVRAYSFSRKKWINEVKDFEAGQS